MHSNQYASINNEDIGILFFNSWHDISLIKLIFYSYYYGIKISKKFFFVQVGKIYHFFPALFYYSDNISMKIKENENKEKTYGKLRRDWSAKQFANW